MATKKKSTKKSSGSSTPKFGSAAWNAKYGIGPRKGKRKKKKS